MLNLRMVRLSLWLTVTLAVAAAGCSKSSPPAPAAADTNRQIYQVKGIVVAVKPQEHSVEIKHEAIPHYMGAMQMPFDVRDTNELAGLEPGDPVSFRLTVTSDDGWIDQIQKTGAKTNLLPVSIGSFRVSREVEPLKVGDPFPEFHLTNQLGEAFSTAQFKGQVLAINFLFTRCPFPTYCPATAKNFSEVQQKLRSRTDATANWHLLTLSFDPEYDTPEVLRRYAETYECDPARWTFATGTLDEIRAIGDLFSLTFWRDTPTALPTHNLRTVVVDPAGRVQTIIPGNEWKPDDLIAEMEKAARVK